MSSDKKKKRNLLSFKGWHGSSLSYSILWGDPKDKISSGSEHIIMGIRKHQDRFRLRLAPLEGKHRIFELLTCLNSQMMTDNINSQCFQGNIGWQSWCRLFRLGLGLRLGFVLGLRLGLRLGLGFVSPDLSENCLRIDIDSRSQKEQGYLITFTMIWWTSTKIA